MTKTKETKKTKSDDQPVMKTYLFSPQYSGLTQKIVIGILLLPVVIGFFLLLNMYLVKKNTKYRLSPDRLTVQSGIFTKTMSNLELWRVSDVQFKQSPIQVMFGDCTIELITKDVSHPIMNIEGLSVKRAKAVYDILNRYVAHALRQGGVMQTI